MLKRLYKSGCFDYYRFIINNSKKLSLSTNEMLVLIKILDECKETNNFKIESIALNLLMTKPEIEEALAKLMEKGFYEIYISYDEGLGVESILLDGFFDKVCDILNDKKEVSNDELHQIIKLVSENVNRILTSQEIELITSLVIEDRYILEDFDSACKYLKENKKVITIKAIAQVIGNQETPDVRPTPGYVKDFFKSIK